MDTFWNHRFSVQRKACPINPGLVDFAIRILKLKFKRTVINPANQIFFRLVKMTLGLVHAIAQFVNYSLPKWQAVQLTLHPGRGGGGTAIYGLYRYVPL